MNVGKLLTESSWLKKFLTVPTNNIIEELLLPLYKQYLSKTHEFRTNKEIENGVAKQWVWIKLKENYTTKETLVAHIDTVSHYAVAPKYEEILLNMSTGVMSLSDKAPAGIACLGGDDRAGMALIWGLVRDIVKNKGKVDFNLFFPSGEETGLQGTKAFLDVYGISFKTPYMLEFDRKGNDIVDYSNTNAEFTKTLEIELEKTKGWGSCSDISEFQRKLKIISANISVGYMNQHTRNETIDVITWNETKEKMLALIMNEEVREDLRSMKWIDKAPANDNWDLDTSAYPDPIGSVLDEYETGYDDGYEQAMKDVAKEPDKYIQQSKALIFIVNAITKKVSDEMKAEFTKMNEDFMETAQTAIFESRKRKWWTKKN